MALQFKQLCSPNPWRKRVSFWLTGGETNEAPQATTEQTEAQKQATEKIDAAKNEKLLTQETATQLEAQLQKIAKENPDKLTEHLKALDEAIAEIERVEALQKDYPGYKGELASVLKARQALWTEDLTQAEINTMRQARQQAEEKIEQKEAYLKKVDDLRSHALNYVEDKNNESPLNAKGLKAGETYTANFRVEAKDKTNSAELYIRLGDILKGSGIDKVTVHSKKANTDTTAYLWSNGKTYNKPQDQAGAKYVAIYNGDTFTIPAKTETTTATTATAGTPAEAPAAPATAPEASATTAPASPAAPSGGSFETATSAAPAIAETGGPTSSYIETSDASAVSDGTSPTPETTPAVGSAGGSSTPVEAPAEPTASAPAPDAPAPAAPVEAAPASTATPAAAPTEATATAETPATTAEATPETSSEVTEARLSAALRSENSWEQIQNMKDKANGGLQVYNAIKKLADFRNNVIKVPTDNRSMWEDLKGFNKNEITLDEIIRAAYNLNLGQKGFAHPTDWLNSQKNSSDSDTKTRAELVYNAAQDILSNVEKLTVSDQRTDRQAYDDLRDPSKAPEKMKSSAALAAQIFAPESYGPPIRLNAFQSLCLTLRGDKRPIVSEDNWLDPMANHRRKGEEPNYGEVELVSSARAYDTLMQAQTPEAFLAKLNGYREMGIAQIAAMKTLDNRWMDNNPDLRKFKAANASAFTDPTANPTRDQIIAVHYGMMLEAAQNLSLMQEAEKLKAEAAAASRTDGLGGAIEGTARAIQNSDGVDGEFGAGAGVGTGLSPETTASLSAREVYNTSAGFDTQASLTIATEHQGQNGGETGASASLTASLLTGDIGASAEAHAGHAFKNKDGSLSSWGHREQIGAYAGTRGFGAEARIGLERNMGRAYQERLAKFKEKYAEDITAAKTQMVNAIKETEAYQTADEKTQAGLEAAATTCVDLMVEQGVANNWTSLAHQLKFAGVGLSAGIGTEGLSGGVYLKFAFGFRPVTLYIPHPGETDPVTGEPKMEWRDGESTQNDLAINEHIYTEEGEKAAQETAANTEIQNSKEDRNDYLKNNGLTLTEVSTEGGLKGYHEMAFANLNGRVRLFVDPAAKMDVVTDGSKNYLNVAPDSGVHMVIRRIASGFNQMPEVQIILSTNPIDNADTIIAQSPQVLEWMQVPSGAMANAHLENNGANAVTTSVEAKMVDTSAASPAIPDLREATLGDYVKIVTRQEIRHSNNAENNAYIFEDNGKEGYQKAQAIGQAFWEKYGKATYDKLSMGDDQDALNGAIAQMYADKYPESYSTKESVPVDLIYMARQKAMELGRPDIRDGEAAKKIAEWNSAANIAFMGNDADAKAGAELFNAYMQFQASDGHLREDETSSKSIPAGSEMFIAVNIKGEKTPMLGYYDRELHGVVHIPIQWDRDNPEATLTALGIPKDQPNQEEYEAYKKQVLAVANHIAGMEWKDSPYNHVSFDKAAVEKMTDEQLGKAVQAAGGTIPGSLLMNDGTGDALYGDPFANQIRQAITDGKVTEDNKNAIKAYLENVADLLDKSSTDGKTQTPTGAIVVRDWEITTGLYDKCTNLLLGRNMILKYAVPDEHEVRSSVQTQSKDNATSPVTHIENRSINIGMGLPSFNSNPSEGGTGSHQDQVKAGDHTQNHDQTLPQ